MKELLLCLFVVGAVFVTSAIAVLSVTETTRYVQAEGNPRLDFNVALITRNDPLELQSKVNGSNKTIPILKSHLGSAPDGLPIVICETGCIKKREVPRRFGTFGILIRTHYILSMRKHRREAETKGFRKRNTIDGSVRNFRHLFQQILKSRAGISLDGDRVIKKRELGIDREPDFVAMKAIETRDIPLGNHDSLSYDGNLASRKVRVLEVNDSPQERPKKEVTKISSNVHEGVKEDTAETMKHKIENSRDRIQSNEEQEMKETFSFSVIPRDSNIIDQATDDSVSDKRITTGKKLDTLREMPTNWSRFLTLKTVLVNPRSIMFIPFLENDSQEIYSKTNSDGNVNDLGEDFQKNTNGLRAARSHLHVAICVLTVMMVALLAAATPAARRLAMERWQARRHGRGGGGSGAGDDGDDELLVPHSALANRWGRGACGWTRECEGAGAGDALAATHVNPRVSLSRLRAALLRAVDRQKVQGPDNLPLTSAAPDSGVCV